MDAAKPTRQKMLDALGSCYSPEVGDWALTLHHTLTEPTCPGATVAPETPFPRKGKQFGGFQAIGDTVDEAIDGALWMAYRVLILREGFEPGVPWTNFGDADALPKIIQALDAKNEAS